MKKIILSSLLASSVFLFTGCQSKINYYDSYNDIDFNINNNKLADDIVNTVSKYYLPAKTNFFILVKKSNDKKFVNEMESKLRHKGYAVSYEYVKNKTLPFAWKIDLIAKDMIRSTYNIDNATFSKIYKVDNNNLIGVGPFTVQNLDELKEIEELQLIEIKPIENINNIEKDNFTTETKIEQKPIVSLEKVNVRSLKVRAEANKNSSIIGGLKRGEIVEIEFSVLSNNIWWAKLKNSGYVQSDFLTGGE